MKFLLVGLLLLLPTVADAATDIVNDPTLSSGLQACYELNETSGVRNDSGANNNDLASTNSVSFGTGKIGNAADFNGSNQYLSIVDGSQTGLDLSNNLTISAWINLDGLGSDAFYAVASKWTNGGNQRSFEFGYTNNPGATVNQIFLSWSNDGASDAGFIASGHSSALAAGTWVHIAAVKSGTDGSVYINGSEVTGSGSNATVFNSTSAFSVGARASGPAGLFPGLIDVMAVWNTAKSDADIASLYNAGAAIPCSVAVAAVPPPFILFFE